MEFKLLCYLLYLRYIKGIICFYFVKFLLEVVFNRKVNEGYYKVWIILLVIYK